MKERKSILGRGLDELFESRPQNLAPRELSVEDIAPGSSQPRKYFDSEKIEQLSVSIRETGVIQPILVRPTHDPKKFVIIAGERRWLAAKSAGLEFIPVVIKEMTDREALKIGIIENIQREDLTIIEEAEAYQRLIDEHHYTQDMVANEVAKSRSHVANTLRLLTLPQEVKTLLVTGKISAGHARALINDKDAVEKAKKIIENKMNVRDVERENRKKNSVDIQLNTQDVRNIEITLTQLLEAKAAVSIMKDKIRLTIDFSSIWKLEDFMEELEKSGRKD